MSRTCLSRFFNVNQRLHTLQVNEGPLRVLAKGGSDFMSDRISRLIDFNKFQSCTFLLLVVSCVLVLSCLSLLLSHSPSALVRFRLFDCLSLSLERERERQTDRERERERVSE